MSRRVGAQTQMLDQQPSILEGAAVVGSREGQGPLGRRFDYISQDAYFGESSWGEGGERNAEDVFRPRLRPRLSLRPRNWTSSSPGTC